MAGGLQAFLNKWITPPTLIAAAGLIAWGVTQGITTSNLAKVQAAQGIEQSEIREAMNTIVITQAENAIIVNNMAKQLGANTDNIALNDCNPALIDQRLKLIEQRLEARQQPGG